MRASLSDECYFRTEFIEILVFYVDKFRRVCYAVRAYLGILQLCNFVVFLHERRDGARNFAFWQDQLKTSIHGMQSPTLSGGRITILLREARPLLD